MGVLKIKLMRWLLAAIGLLVVLLMVGERQSGTSPQQAPVVPLFVTVEQAPLEILVQAAGSLKARDQVVISNTLEGRTMVLSLVEEGSRVEKGDQLIELDSSALQDKLVDQQISVQNSQAAFVQARENLEVVKNQSQSDLEDARLALQFAEDDLNKYLQGEFPQQKKEELADIALKEEELRRAEEKLSWSKVLYEETFLSQTELQADELAAKKARIDLELSQSNLAMLQEFTHVRKLTELKAEVNKKNMALERSKRKAKADVIQAEAELQAKQAKLERENAKLQKINDEIAKTVIRAPQDGVVVYATSLQRSWRGNVEPLAAGQEVRERQELIYLPAPGAMVATSQIHESNLEKVQVGQGAKVYVDSLPGQAFNAKVKSVAMFPDASTSWLNPDLKVYRTDLELLDEVDGLRSGMNCRVAIEVASYPAALSVPIQAVVLAQGQSFVYCQQDGEVVRQAVELGLSNESRVQVLRGLQAGDRVQINPTLKSVER